MARQKSKHKERSWSSDDETVRSYRFWRDRAEWLHLLL